MKILFVCQEEPWPPHSGGRLRTCALIQALAKKNEVTLATPVAPEGVQAQIDGLKGCLADLIPLPPTASKTLVLASEGGRLRRMASTIVDHASTRLPYYLRLTHPEIVEPLRKLFPKFDAAFSRYIRAMPLLDGFPVEKTIIDVDDLHHVGLWRSIRQGIYGFGAPMAAMEAGRIYFHTQNICRKAAKILLASERDMAQIHSPRKLLIRNGFNPPDPAFLVDQPVPESITFVGLGSYGPNLDGLRWFVQNVWPHVRRELPRAVFRIVGRETTPDWLPFAVGVEGVELVGEVPETVSWFSSSMLSVVPLLNGMGTRIKILESLACGTPVVATNIGAEGFDDIGTDHGVFRIDAADAMAKKVVDLLRNSAQTRAVGAAGKDLVMSRYSWEATMAPLANEAENWVAEATDKARKRGRPASV